MGRLADAELRITQSAESIALRPALAHAPHARHERRQGAMDCVAAGVAAATPQRMHSAALGALGSGHIPQALRIMRRHGDPASERAV